MLRTGPVSRREPARYPSYVRSDETVRVLEPPDGVFAPASGESALEVAPSIEASAAALEAAPTLQEAFDPGAFDPSRLDPAYPSGHLVPAPDPAPDAPAVAAESLEPRSYPLVLVHWLDAWYDPDEQTAEDWRPDYPVQTVGYLVRDERCVISIAQEVLPDDEGFRAVTHIPRAMVQKVTRLAVDLPDDATARPA
jgi:hypothetical protein